MGKTIRAMGYCEYIVPHLTRFCHDISVKMEDYVYIVQDETPSHKANYTKGVYRDEGLTNYVFP